MRPYERIRRLFVGAIQKENCPQGQERPPAGCESPVQGGRAATPADSSKAKKKITQKWRFYPTNTEKAVSVMRNAYLLIAQLPKDGFR